MLKKYKKKLQKLFNRPEQRAQFNVMCDKRLIELVRGLARDLEAPIFCITEHLLEIGVLEIAFLITDADQKQALQRHLVQNHLLVSKLDPLDHKTSHRLQRMQMAMSLFETLEKSKGTEAAREIITSIINETSSGEVKESNWSPNIDEWLITKFLIAIYDKEL